MARWRQCYILIYRLSKTTFRKFAVPFTCVLLNRATNGNRSISSSFVFPFVDVWNVCASFHVDAREFGNILWNKSEHCSVCRSLFYIQLTTAIQLTLCSCTRWHHCGMLWGPFRIFKKRHAVRTLIIKWPFFKKVHLKMWYYFRLLHRLNAP